MRPFLIFTFFFFIGTFGFSQDVILKKDGKKIEAKVLEVSTTQIKYKREDQQDLERKDRLALPERWHGLYERPPRLYRL